MQEQQGEREEEEEREVQEEEEEQGEEKEQEDEKEHGEEKETGRCPARHPRDVRCLFSWSRATRRKSSGTSCRDDYSRSIIVPGGAKLCDVSLIKRCDASTGRDDRATRPDPVERTKNADAHARRGSELVSHVARTIKRTAGEFRATSPPARPAKRNGGTSEFGPQSVDGNNGTASAATRILPGHNEP